MSHSKFGAKAVWYCPITKAESEEKVIDSQIYFPSRLELRVYKELLQVSNTHLDRQVPIQIKPDCNFFPSLSWKCDFRIWFDDSMDKWYYIEAKGVVTPEFKLQMQMFEQNDPEGFRHLIIVSDKPTNLSKIQLKPSQIVPFFTVLGEL